jgi:hypothetical protein
MDDNWSTNECRDITWCVEFNVCVNGTEIDFSELTDIEKEKILEDIKNDYSCGTF